MSRILLPLLLIVLVSVCVQSAPAEHETVPVTFYNKCKQDLRLNCTMEGKSIGGEEGVVVPAEGEFTWDSDSGFWNMKHYSCQVRKGSQKIDFQGFAGGYNLHPNWHLDDEGIGDQYASDKLRWSEE